MSLSTAMMSALSGLRATQAGLDVVSNNVANAGSKDYSRKTLTNRELVVGNGSAGVRTGEVSRILDKLVQRQMWTETAGGAYTAKATDFHDRLDSLFGQPGDTTSLDGIFNSFTQSVQALASTPDSTTSRTEVLSNARILAQQLNGMSSDIQSMRSQTEQSLASGVADANSALQQIQLISDKITKSGTSPAPAALLDARDGYISQLSSLMDIKVVGGDNDQISIFTTAGALLFDGQAAVLGFDSFGDLGTQSAYSTDPAVRSVGTISLTSANGSKTDLIGSRLIRSGELGALVELRDKTLVEAQTQLDTIAAQMATALSNKTVAGTPAAAGGATGFSVDLAGLQPGNPLTIGVTEGGTARQITFIEVSDPATLPLPPSANGGAKGTEVIGYSGGAAGAAAAIGARLGAAFTASATGTVVTVLDDGAAGTSDVTGLSASITSTALTGNGVELPLFVDAGRGTLYTGSFDGGSQRTGFAARIGVNKAVLADSSLLVQFGATTLPRDSTRPQFVLDALTKTQSRMPPDTGIGGSANPFLGTVGTLTRSVVEAQGRNAQTAKSINEGQQIVVNTLADKLQATSGVNVDTEMSNLLELQNAYAANARVMSTIRDMLATLMNM